MIRPARKGDIEFITRAMALIPRAAQGSDPYMAGLPREPAERARQFVVMHLASPDSIVLVAEDPEKPLGCLIGQRIKAKQAT